MYRHTQAGSVIIWTLGPAAAGLLISASVAHVRGAPAWTVVYLCFLAFLIGLVGFVFSSMTVCVDEKGVRVFFGPDWLPARMGFRKFLPAAEIVSCRVVAVTWWWGYGIRIIPRGVMYRVSGRRCVEMTLKSGRRALLGSDEPDELCRQIEGRFSRDIHRNTDACIA